MEAVVELAVVEPMAENQEMVDQVTLTEPVDIRDQTQHHQVEQNLMVQGQHRVLFL